jgi:hypothetical protein
MGPALPLAHPLAVLEIRPARSGGGSHARRPANAVTGRAERAPVDPLAEFGGLPVRRVVAFPRPFSSHPCNSGMLELSYGSPHERNEDL